MEVRRVGICVKPEQEQLADLVRVLARWLEDRGLEVVCDAQSARWVGAPEVPRGDLAAKVDLVIVLGGDGTLLAVARAVGSRKVPILGVNLGTLGYLTETASEELYDALESVLAGGFRVEERMRIGVRIESRGEILGEYLALNDAVETLYGSGCRFHIVRQVFWLHQEMRFHRVS